MIDFEKLKYADIVVSNEHPPTEEDFREISAFIKAHKEKLVAEEQLKKLRAAARPPRKGAKAVAK